MLQPRPGGGGGGGAQSCQRHQEHVSRCKCGCLGVSSQAAAYRRLEGFPGQAMCPRGARLPWFLMGLTGPGHQLTKFELRNHPPVNLSECLLVTSHLSSRARRGWLCSFPTMSSLEEGGPFPHAHKVSIWAQVGLSWCWGHLHHGSCFPCVASSIPHETFMSSTLKLPGGKKRRKQESID